MIQILSNNSKWDILHNNKWDIQMQWLNNKWDISIQCNNNRWATLHSMVNSNLMIQRWPKS